MKTDLAWAAGFFDGEGTIYQLGNTAYVYCWQSSLEPLKRLQQILGAGKVYNKPERGSYAYYVGGENGIIVLKKLLPYLLVKKDKALIAIESRKYMKRKPYKQRSKGIASL